MYKKYEKISCYILLIVMLLSLLPIMYLGRYDHPTGDDYYYGINPRRVLAEGGGFGGVLKEAAKGVVYEYYHWQGTYSAIFLMYLPPNMLGDDFYHFVPTFLLIAYTGAVFWLLKPVVCVWLKGSRYLWCGLSSAFVLFTVQLVPFKLEAFYWYTGAMYYTGFFSATLFFFGLLFRYLISGKRILIPLLMLLAVFLAGGNYVTLLPCMLLVCTMTVGLIRKRSAKGFVTGAAVLLMLAGLAVSASAPGNWVRGEHLGDMSAVKAIVKSLVQGSAYLLIWLNRWWLMALIALTPLMWHTYGRITYRFRYPLIVVGYLYGIFCSMFCPTIYAVNSAGPDRALAAIYYSCIGFSFLAYYYLLGYFYRWCESSIVLREETSGRTPKLLAAGAFVFLALMQVWALGDSTSLRALYYLYNGEAAAYEQEYRERLAVLEDDTVRDVVFTPYEHRPDMLYMSDLTEDPGAEDNRNIAEYFHKNSVITVKP